MNRAWRHTFPLTALFPSAIPIGSQRVRAICPDPKHAETHPSCVVNYDSTHGWKWHCFACGADGDALDVLTGREGMTVREALRLLCDSSDHVVKHGLTAMAGEDPISEVPQHRWLGLSSSHGTTASDVLVLICDACRNETAEFSKRAYRLMGVRRDGLGVPDRLSSTPAFWTASADLELATLPGWELSAGLQFAIGPKCLERIGA